VTNEKDNDADRDPKPKGEIHERRQEKAKISTQYIEAKRQLPDDR